MVLALKAVSGHPQKSVHWMDVFLAANFVSVIALCVLLGFFWFGLNKNK
jgi:hypothetical protein